MSSCRSGARATLAASVACIAALVLAAPVSASVTVKPRRVIKVALTKAGCAPRLEALAGDVTFVVKHVSGKRVTEFEVLTGPTIIGEAEDIAIGSKSGFTITLDAGEYTTKCPGGKKHDEGLLVVSAPSSISATP